MKKHVQILACIYITLSILALLAGSITFFVLLGTGLIAKILAQGNQGILAMNILSIIAFCILGFFFLLSLPGLISGIGLLYFKNWARVIIVILSIINIFNVPIGTILSLYSFWTLFSQDTEVLFDRSQKT